VRTGPAGKSDQDLGLSVLHLVSERHDFIATEGHLCPGGMSHKEALELVRRINPALSSWHFAQAALHIEEPRLTLEVVSSFGIWEEENSLLAVDMGRDVDEVRPIIPHRVMLSLYEHPGPHPYRPAIEDTAATLRDLGDDVREAFADLRRRSRPYRHETGLEIRREIASERPDRSCDSWRGRCPDLVEDVGGYRGQVSALIRHPARFARC